MSLNSLHWYQLAIVVIGVLLGFLVLGDHLIFELLFLHFPLDPPVLGENYILLLLHLPLLLISHGLLRVADIEGLTQVDGRRVKVSLPMLVVVLLLLLLHHRSAHIALVMVLAGWLLQRLVGHLGLNLDL